MTELKTALAIAKESQREVILYTGRVIFCGTNSPRSHFFDVLVPAYPQLQTRSNRYVVCEQFIYAPNGPSGLTPAFFEEAKKYEGLYEKYQIKRFYPALTFLDAAGVRSNGPFEQWSPTVEFGTFEYNAYSTLRDYLDEEHPLRLDQAQSNLVAVLCSTNVGQKAVGLFRYYHSTTAGERQVLLDNGTKTRYYRIGAPFTFLIRETTLSSGPAGSTVSAVGGFGNSKPLADTEGFMVYLNGAWFRTYMRAVGTRPGRLRKDLGLTSSAGEFYFDVSVQDKCVGEALRAGLERLRAQK